MKSFRLKTLFAAAMTLMLASLPSAYAEELINAKKNQLAVKGYDVVAYFTIGAPTPGSEDFEYVWRDVRWRFSSMEHKVAFESDPTKYTPRYGGYCAGGMALGRRAPIDPEAFVIVDGKLYLNFDKPTAEEFRATPEESIAKADANWEQMNKP